MAQSIRIAMLLTLVAGFLAAADAPDADRRARAVTNTKLALDLARGSLQTKQYVEAVQLADLADRCAGATGDTQFAGRTLAITNEIRGQCPPEKVEEARKIIRDLTGRLENAATNPASRPAPVETPDPSRKRNTEFTLEQGRLVLTGPIVFEAGGAIAKESEPSLYLILDYLEVKPLITTLRIEGHTDRAGSPEKNQSLSGQQAAAVARWLMVHGADPRRLLPVGFGSTRPPARDSAPDARGAQRIEIHPAALRGQPIAGRPVDGGGKVVEWK